jgi:hypothetical protein
MVMQAINRRLSLVPRGAVVLEHAWTAPGLWIERDGTGIIALLDLREMETDARGARRRSPCAENQRRRVVPARAEDHRATGIKWMRAAVYGHFLPPDRHTTKFWR